MVLLRICEDVEFSDTFKVLFIVLLFIYPIILGIFNYLISVLLDLFDCLIDKITKFIKKK